jgi:hypothetical protein
VSCGW